MTNQVEIWQLVIGLALAVAMGAYGLKLMRTPVQKRPRIMRQWPKPNTRDDDTADLVPPSQRKSSELRPPTVAKLSSGG